MRKIITGGIDEKRKVVVAMSGGVDSSVAAALLKKKGFKVIGIFMKLADLPIFKERERKAREVAKILDIPFYVLNFEKEFKRRVVDYFLKEYKAGNTPNPCVICNKEIKFGLLLEKTLSLDANYVATGHYARLRREILNPKSEILKLYKGKDKEKDQSYFLWMLKQEQLKRILFPIGSYTKKEVRKLAKKFKLPVFNVPESMEICFIQTTINDFLKKYLKTKPGKIVDKKGKVLGLHEGLWFYTIGQRKGIKLPGGPYYVLDKDLKKNLLIVTKNEKDLYKKELIAKNVNWILRVKPNLPLKVKAKIRYRHKAALATIYSVIRDTRYKIRFEKPQRAITPGQSVVFYKGQEVLGGGIIL